MVEMVPWRGARDERSWPKLWQFGSENGSGFPWVPFDKPRLAAIAGGHGVPAIESAHWADR
jgi:hypothetical protein